MKKILFILIGGMLAGLTACTNGDWEFDDFEYQSVYFAYQYPVRTIVLGDDIFDTTLDNEWKCQIMATTAGVYNNPHDVTVDISVDNNMTQNMQFEDGTNVMTMPSNYYSLSDDQIVIKKGELIGGVEVQLTDAFFADPEAIRNTYVIPMQMSNVSAADTILSGQPQVENPRRTVSGDWAVQPKDFILYAIKYINQYHGNYLRRGVDEVTGNGGNTALDETVVRHEQYVEYDEVNSLVTQSLSILEFPLVFTASDGTNINCTLELTFDQDHNCTISSNDFPATGTGRFVTDGEVKSWGDQDRDALYLEYEIELPEVTVSTTDTLVMRDRGVSIELFNPVVN